jgi:molecular chaperone GrpE
VRHLFLHPAAEAGGSESLPTDEPVDDPSVDDAISEDSDEPTDDAPIIDPQIVWYQSRIASLQKDLAGRDEKLHEYIAAYKQAVSEMDAVRERLERDKEKVIDRDRMDLVGKMLDVLDNFDRSIDGVKAGSDVGSIRQGLTMVRGQFAQVMSGFGVERMSALGAVFDAGVHEAAGMIPAQGDQTDQQVVFEERAGYTFKGKLLRAARVIIATRPG